jgi:hypothetical protein
MSTRRPRRTAVEAYSASRADRRTRASSRSSWEMPRRASSRGGLRHHVAVRLVGEADPDQRDRPRAARRTAPAARRWAGRGGLGCLGHVAPSGSRGLAPGGRRAMSRAVWAPSKRIGRRPAYGRSRAPRQRVADAETASTAPAGASRGAPSRRAVPAWKTRAPVRLRAARGRRSGRRPRWRPDTRATRARPRPPPAPPCRTGGAAASPPPPPRSRSAGRRPGAAAPPASRGRRSAR